MKIPPAPRPLYKRTFPVGMIPMHRREYVKRLREIRFNEFHGINSGYNEHLRNANHILVSLYLCPRLF